MAVIALAVLVTDGKPVLYISTRRVWGQASIRIKKFRTMIRNAERLVNRDTIPVGDGPRFLNVPIESKLYTKIGRLIERCSLTELPQLFHVLAGKMSLVGNRPLPENVIQSLREKHPYAEERFRTKCGLTGPVQLVGRDVLSDEDRLRLETAYCSRCVTRYSVLLDAYILFYTVLIGLRLRAPKPLAEVERLVALPATMPRPVVSSELAWWLELETEPDRI